MKLSYPLPWPRKLHATRATRHHQISHTLARLLLAQRPRFAVLDESTSACDAAAEAACYELVQEACEGWLSVGHRTSIERFHGRRLLLREGGEWAVEELGDAVVVR